jgi:hypothetical protein
MTKKLSAPALAAAKIASKAKRARNPRELRDCSGSILAIFDQWLTRNPKAGKSPQPSTATYKEIASILRETKYLERGGATGTDAEVGKWIRAKKSWLRTKKFRGAEVKEQKAKYQRDNKEATAERVSEERKER